MKKIIFLATVSFCLNLHAEDLLFSCKGILVKEYVGERYIGKKSNYEFKEHIGVIVKNSQIILSADSSMMRIPTQYSHEKVESGFNFPICNKENHKILFNNFSCNYAKTFNDVKNTMSIVDLFEGSFDGITNKLIIRMRPTNEKIDSIQKQKSGVYSIETGEYQCSRREPSF